MVQQNIGGTGRIYAQRGTNDAAGGVQGFDQIVLEVFVQKISGAHRHETNKFIDLLFAHVGEFFCHEDHFSQIPGPQRSGVSWSAQQKMANQLGVAHQV